jgi:hypothetical protein
MSTNLERGVWYVSCSDMVSEVQDTIIVIKDKIKLDLKTRDVAVDTSPAQLKHNPNCSRQKSSP